MATTVTDPRAAALAPRRRAADPTPEPWPKTQHRGLWLGVHCPALSLEAVGAPAQMPAVVWQQDRGQRRVYVANPAAEQLGIAPSMSLVAAQTLCASLHGQRRDPLAERTLIQGLAKCAQHWTPNVALGEHGILLELAASVALFGGQAAMLEQIRAQLGTQWACQFALALTPAAARVLAEYQPDSEAATSERLRTALRALPVAALALPERTEQRLQRCGLQHIGDLLRLARHALGRRFGAELLLRLERLYGQRADPQRAEQVAPDHTFERHWLSPCRCKEALQHGLTALLQQALQRLRRQGLAVAQIDIAVWGTRRERAVQWSLHSAEPTLEVAVFRRLLLLQLERQTLPEEVMSFQLKMVRLWPYRPPPQDLWRDAQPQRHWAQAMAEVALKLEGQGQLYRLLCHPDARPECASRRRHDAQGEGDIPKGLSVRPLWLLPRARPFRRTAQHSLSANTERIESGWWDGAPCRRDYYRCTLAQGPDLWVYWDWQRKQWFQHGVFA